MYLNIIRTGKIIYRQNRLCREVDQVSSYSAVEWSRHGAAKRSFWTCLIVCSTRAMRLFDGKANTFFLRLATTWKPGSLQKRVPCSCDDWHQNLASAGKVDDSVSNILRQHNDAGCITEIRDIVGCDNLMVLVRWRCTVLRQSVYRPLQQFLFTLKDLGSRSLVTCTIYSYRHAHNIFSRSHSHTYTQ